MTDFEVSIINAAKEHFWEDSVKCCFFHLCQNVFRQIVQSGLKTLYNSDDGRIEKGTHQLCALAFVWVEDVERHFITLRAVLPDELSDIADWFEVNYIRRRVARRRGSAGLLLRSYPPRYPPRLWEVSLTILLGLRICPKAGTADSSMSWENTTTQACTLFLKSSRRSRKKVKECCV